MGALRKSINWKQSGYEEKLDKWWNEDGLSAGQIGAKLGLTRNAVLGKVHRMGWSGKRHQTMSESERKAIRPAAPKRQRRGKNAHAVEVLRSPDGKCSTRITIRAADPAPHERVSFEHKTGCSWPFDEPCGKVTWCNRKRADNSSYCEEHHHRAHTKLRRSGRPFLFNKNLRVGRWV